MIKPGAAALLEKRTESIGPLVRSVTSGLNVLLIDAQPRAFPYTKLRTLTLPRLAGATPSNHRVKIIDGRVEKIRVPEGTDLVGVTFSTNNAALAHEVAARARAAGALAVAGGTHATAMPEEVLMGFDAVLTGEAEGGAWEELLRDAETGEMKKIYRNAEPPAEWDKDPPRLDLLTGRYLPAYPVEATRGCPNRCAFCFNRYIHPTFRTRQVERVIEDARRADAKSLFFMDDNLAADRSYAKEIFAALLPLQKRIYFQTQLSAARDPELLDLMARAGAKAAFVGLESVSSSSLDSVGKTCNRVGQYKEYISAFTERGILVFGGLIFGLDGDDPDSFKRTLSFLKESSICGVAANLAIPYPGTDYHARTRERGRLLDENYEKYTGYVPLVRPTGMTLEELEQGYDYFIREFYSVKNSAARFRAMDLPLSRLPLFIAAGFAFRFPRRSRERTASAQIKSYLGLGRASRYG